MLYDVFVYEKGVLIFEALDLDANSIDPLPYVPGAEYLIQVDSKDDLGSFSSATVTVTAPEL